MPAKFTCQFTMDNAAFEDDYAEETKRILAGIVMQVIEYKTGGKIRDYNGNTIGSWSLR